jgi:hypothetical protein
MMFKQSLTQFGFILLTFGTWATSPSQAYADAQSRLESTLQEQLPGCTISGVKAKSGGAIAAGTNLVLVPIHAIDRITSYGIAKRPYFYRVSFTLSDGPTPTQFDCKAEWDAKADRWSIQVSDSQCDIRQNLHRAFLANIALKVPKNCSLPGVPKKTISLAVQKGPQRAVAQSGK